MNQSESSSGDSPQDICNEILDLYPNPVSQNPNDSSPASPSTKSEHEPDEVPVEIHAPRLEPEDLKKDLKPEDVMKELQLLLDVAMECLGPCEPLLKRKTPESTDPNDSDGSLEVTTVLSSRKHSSNEDKTYGSPSLPGICTLCGGEYLTSAPSYRSTSSPTTSSASRSSSQKYTASTLVCSPSMICSTQEPGLDNDSSDSGMSNCNSAGTPNLSRPGRGSCSPHSFATENNVSRESPDVRSLTETAIDRMQLSSSASDPSGSQNVQYVLKCAVVPAGPARVTFLDTNVQYPCFTDMSWVELTIPPTMPTHAPQLTRPPAMQFPEAPAPLHSQNRPSCFPRSQQQTSSIPPTQSVSSASTLQYPPPPPLHISRPELVSNPVPQSSSNTTRLLPVTEAFYPPDRGQVSKITRSSHPSNTHRPPLSQNAPRPSFHAGFYAPFQTTHPTVRQNSSHHTVQNPQSMAQVSKPPRTSHSSNPHCPPLSQNATQPSFLAGFYPPSQTTHSTVRQNSSHHTVQNPQSMAQVSKPPRTSHSSNPHCPPLSQNATQPSFHAGFYPPSQTTHSTVQQRSSHPTYQNPQNMAQVSMPPRTSHSSNPHCPPLSQNAPRPSFHTSFYPPSQTTHSTVQQNSSYPTFQNVCRHGVQATYCPVRQNSCHPTFQTAHDRGIQNTVYYHSRPDLMLQNLPVAVMLCPAAHGDYQGYSNSVPRLHETRNTPSSHGFRNARPSRGPDSRHPPIHMRDIGTTHELGRVGARNPYDHNVYPDLHQEISNQHAYSGIAHERNFSGYDRNHEPRHAGPNQYTGYSYYASIPPYLHLTPYPPAPGQYYFDYQSGSYQWF